MTALDDRPSAASPGAAEGRHRDTSFAVDRGRGWFPQDAASHRRDAPRFCPACAAPLALADGGHGIATEYWVAHDRVFVCLCGSCGWSGDVVLAERVVGHEPPHDD
jgi:hypothetical protein